MVLSFWVSTLWGPRIKYPAYQIFIVQFRTVTKLQNYCYEVATRQFFGWGAHHNMRSYINKRVKKADSIKKAENHWPK